MGWTLTTRVILLGRIPGLHGPSAWLSRANVPDLFSVSKYLENQIRSLFKKGLARSSWLSVAINVSTVERFLQKYYILSHLLDDL